MPSATRSPSAVFLLLAYGFSWSWCVALLLAGETVAKDPWPTHLPALAGPALAAVLTTAMAGGRPGLRALAGGLTRWRIGARWWLAALAPLLVGALAFAAAALLGDGPRVEQLGRFSGTAHGIGWVVLACLFNGFGEETGWRGFLLPRLQERWGALRATALVALAWAAWHLPFFFLLDSYADFTALQLPGFLLGMLAGAAVLTWLYDHTGGSILAVAIWHASYNLAVATSASEGAVAAVVTTAVMVGAVAVIPDLRRRPRPGER